ncbi:hypothetical protein CDD80_7254 [Ophiocordyceps camponoti-rufipedis]|uniref:Uncharacterized protein n=1 Tax=Ophiocordyceps camponoti-rufipedis TaxID=2004952 RepID=A0A2C5XR33_9HYPO|nr:hypothetical protein CDD80_7254 [Ophiocordyceps camponoti-rufipedis]
MNRAVNHSLRLTRSAEPLSPTINKGSCPPDPSFSTGCFNSTSTATTYSSLIHDTDYTAQDVWQPTTPGNAQLATQLTTWPCGRGSHRFPFRRTGPASPLGRGIDLMRGTLQLCSANDTPTNGIDTAVDLRDLIRSDSALRRQHRDASDNIVEPAAQAHRSRQRPTDARETRMRMKGRLMHTLICMRDTESFYDDIYVCDSALHMRLDYLDL